MQLERQLFSVWMGWLTSGWMHENNRAKFNRMLRIVDDELQSSEVHQLVPDQRLCPFMSLQSLACRPAAPW